MFPLSIRRSSGCMAMHKPRRRPPRRFMWHTRSGRPHPATIWITPWAHFWWIPTARCACVRPLRGAPPRRSVLDACRALPRALFFFLLCAVGRPQGAGGGCARRGGGAPLGWLAFSSCCWGEYVFFFSGGEPPPGPLHAE